ncbi:MAG: 16S rRNA (cytidine(1402)-2'-O)-methyltransferase [Acidobacteriota bacterium]|nr:16S rRNA (cytidine(1402)-2'-O)-methyltransferase [Acidobacteriota bacterium]
MKGLLYVVATPIGHLEDITLRALRILKTVQLVAAEDTRRTGNLLRHYNIDTAVLSVHEHNEGGRVARLLTRLAAGDSIALVTDAGTPGVSDPGATLVAAVRDAGFRVEPIPGASAVVTAISASGMKSEGFCFHGFAPIKAKDRKLWFLALVEASQDRAAVFFEAPHRLRKTLEELRELVKCQIMVARELTKIHEEFVFGTPDELLARFETPQGEFTLVLPPGSKAQNVPMAATDDDIATLFGQLTEMGLGETKRDTARLVAEQLGLTTKVVYDALERVKITRG